MLSNTELEDIVARVIREQDAAGVLMVIVTRDERAELVAAFSKAASYHAHMHDVPGMLRRLAEEVESGGGVPTGRHLQSL